MALNFNTNPYYDDFDEDKNFHRILFRPGRAVQARELTQSQTILQNQIDRFGKHVFQEGSKVTGGETFDETVLSVKLQPTYSGNTINISGYNDYFAFSTTSNAVYKIKKAEAATSTDPNTLFLAFIKGSTVINGNANVTIANSETLRIYSTGDLSSSNIVGNVISSSTESSNTGRLFSVNEGIFFTNGCFVKTPKQTTVVSKYTNNANVTVGFDVTESIVASTSDTSLLDPAIGASNYIAPGADRYKIELTLTTKEITADESISDLTTSKYIELSRYRNGELVKQTQTSVYSVLGDTLARRTYDESGNYRVEGLNPKIPSEKFTPNSIFTFAISPGKAYVKGYEIETVGTTELLLTKSRATESVSGYDVPAYYGNYFYITTANGAVINFSTAEKLELHRNVGAFSASTKIAEAYPKNLEYVSGNGSTSTYKLHLFNIVKTSNTPIDLTRAIIAGNSTSVNATCNISNSSVITRTIAGTNYSYSNVINLASSTGVTVGMEVSGTNISFPTYVTAINGNDITVSGNPVGNNTLQSLTFRSAYLTDTNYDSSVFEASYDVIKQFSQVNYYTKRVFKSVSFVAGVASVQTNDGTERFANVSGANLQRHYAICIRTGGTGSFPNFTWVNLSAGSYISVPSPSVGSPATLNINLGDATFNGTADILTTLDITAATRRTKTLSQNDIKYFTVLDSANTFSLGYADVINVSAIYIATGSNTASNANVNVVGSFDIDLGQRDSFYDHSTIKLKNGATVNTGNTLVIFNRFTHSGTGYFDTLSYPTYDEIPAYTKTDGTVIDLRDSIDFRPIRTANASSNVYSNLSMSFASQQIVDSLIGSVDTDVEYYLRRNDKIVLTKNGTFKTLTGVSALTNPPIPNNEEDSMTLYTLSIDPYTYTASNVKIQVENNKRYTMKDIGSIDNRLTRVEYYTALNLLEKDIASTVYYDDQDNQLFNNGFVVDSFKGHSIGDVFNPDYSCSIDYDNEILRPKFESNGTSLAISSNTLSTTGNLITLTYTSVPYITQNIASETVNVNPFNVIGFIGYVKLEKSSASWADFSTRPDVVINRDNGLDNFVYSNNFPGSKWNDWSLFGYDDETNIVYTYYSSSGQQLQTTTDSRVKSSDSGIIENKLLIYTANTALDFELFGMRPNVRVIAYLDNINVTGYMRKYDSANSVYTTAELTTDSNGYAKGKIYISPTFTTMNAIAIGAAQAGGTRYNGSTDFHSAVKDATGQATYTPVTLNQATTNLTSVRTLPAATSTSLGASARADDYIGALYREVLGRPPDTDGYNYWASVVAGGASLDFVGKAFANAANQNLNQGKETQVKCEVSDPIAQTFFVNRLTNPEGIFVSSIDIYFATKDSSGIPVTLELRPTVNGFPHSDEIIAESEVTLNPSSVNLPTNPNVPVATTFTFRTPIYLEPGEYSFVVKANSDEYTVYIGTIGQQRLDGVGPIVSQPYIGSFFKSQNASTWTPDQNSDICFVMRHCKFAANTVQSAVLTPVSFGYDQTYDLARLNVPFETLGVSANVTFELATKANSTGAMGNYLNVIPNSNIIFNERKIINTSSDANVRIRMITLNEDISPYVDVSGSNYTVVKNLVDSPAAANVTSYPETLASGGGALSKYIVRKVTLSDGFDGSALRVYLQQNLPQGSSIQVYYRVLSATDSDKIENKSWTLMTQTGVSSTNQNATEYYDYEYKADAISYTSGGVTYTNFKTFAIKVVLYSTNPANAPSAKNFRAIALS